MKGDYFSNLPPEITINILSLLPIPAIISCKCVCKSWLSLIKTTEFVESHLSKSPSLVAVFDREMGSKPYRVLEFADDDSAHDDSVVFDFSFPRCPRIRNSVNGLLFLCHLNRKHLRLFVCNPVTREYVKLPRPPGHLSDIIACGFGVSKMTGQYKVVCIFKGAPKCEVYTLGTGSWKTIALEDKLRYVGFQSVFLNGNLHWSAFESKYQRASCFDLETEVFSSFAAPPNPHHLGALIALEGCLCMCYNLENEIVTWMMKEYGNEESWTKAFVLRECWDSICGGYLNPIKVFKDGDMLMRCEEDLQLYCYSKRTQSIRKTFVSKTFGYDPACLLIYTPSFIPLKAFLKEDVRSF